MEISLDLVLAGEVGELSPTQTAICLVCQMPVVLHYEYRPGYAKNDFWLIPWHHPITGLNGQGRTPLTERCAASYTPYLLYGSGPAGKLTRQQAQHMRACVNEWWRVFYANRVNFWKLQDKKKPGVRPFGGISRNAHPVPVETARTLAVGMFSGGRVPKRAGLDLV